MKKQLIYLFYLSTLFLLSACYDPADYEIDRATASRIMHVTANTDSIPADGANMAIILAHVATESAEGRRTVTFTTTSGTFPDASMAPKQTLAAEATIISSLDSARNRIEERAARARLQSSLVAEDALVSAEIAGITDRVRVHFYRVFASNVTAASNSFFIQPNYKKEVEITATLSRSIGKPTIGNLVHFRAVDATGQQRGRFRAIDDSSDEQGKCTAIYGLSDASYMGKIYIICSIPTVADTVVLDVLP